MALYLTAEEQRVVTAAITALNESEIPYSVLRRYEHLPEFVPGPDEKRVDVDILVDSTRFDETVQVLQGLGFRPPMSWGRRGVRRLLMKGARRPWEALYKVVRSPARSLHIVKKSAAGGSRAKRLKPKGPYDYALLDNYRYSMRYESVTLDLKNHLAHESPMNGRRFRLDREVEEYMLQRRRCANGFLYSPAPADELAHLVAHCVFEYRGHFDDYYTQRCEALTDQVFGGGPDNELERQFIELAGFIFYKAGPFVCDHVRRRDFESIRADLRAFADY